LFSKIPAVGEAQNMDRKGGTRRDVRVFAFTPFFCWKITTATWQIWIFLNYFKCKSTFVSFSIAVLLICCFADSVLFSGSRDVFTGLLAQSVQELWLIKFCGPLWWPARALKGF